MDELQGAYLFYRCLVAIIIILVLLIIF